MRVYKCDRCKKFVRLEARSFFFRNPAPLYRFGRKMHVCGDCAKSFRRWLSDPEEKEER